jgi:hypothetical protein
MQYQRNYLEIGLLAGDRAGKYSVVQQKIHLSSCTNYTANLSILCVYFANVVTSNLGQDVLDLYSGCGPQTDSSNIRVYELYFYGYGYA